MPQSLKIIFLAFAVSSDPPTIAPAWPMVLPFGAVSPAIKPIIGFLMLFVLYHLAASVSNCPPISPIRTMQFVSSSFTNSFTASSIVVPIIGSPPMPIAVDIPYPCLTT